MINTSFKFFVDNSDIKIQKRVLFVTAGTAFQYQRVIIYIFGNISKIFQIYCANIVQISAIIMIAILPICSLFLLL